MGNNNLLGMLLGLCILLFILITLTSCNTLEPQQDYCEIAFAYPENQLLPKNIDKDRIGCACSTKDILKGEVTSGWILAPLEKCRRVRGFNPIKWVEVIDPYFKLEYQKRAKKKK